MDNYLLITGGCGYIGSHVTLLLQERGYQLIVLDDFSTGSPQNKLNDVIYITGDIADPACLSKLFNRYTIDTVMHFAAKTSVEESEQQPIKYYEENVFKSITFMHYCVLHRVKRFFFSSTAAIYDSTLNRPVQEDEQVNPHSIYGKTKYLAELALGYLAKQHQIQFIIFRYFNVTGHHHSLTVGNFNPNATALLPKICRNICKNHYSIDIYGNNYPTYDGTTIRDYVHVMDVAQAHLLVFQQIRFAGLQDNMTLNIGYGKGLSVQEMVEHINLFLKRPPLQCQIVNRRHGDIPYSVADNTKISALGWQSMFQNPYQDMILSEINWCQKYFAIQETLK